MGTSERCLVAYMIAAAVCATSAYGGATWYVTPTGTGGGASWGDAGDLQTTVTSAAPGDEVWVAAGIYTATGDTVLIMKEGIAVYGGFTGTESEREQRDWETNTSAIDGENARRCVIGADSGALDGFTITRGVADFGGGMYNHSVSCIVANCAFTDNTAEDAGGAIWNYFATLAITDSTFSGNGAAFEGGAISSYASSLETTDCVFESNTALSGAGMHTLFAGSLVIANSAFTNNAAQYEGGGLYNGSSSPIVTDCSFSGNTARFGGGMYNESSDTTLSRGLFQGNTATRDGGGLYNMGGSATSVNCVFAGNEAARNGGAVAGFVGATQLMNDTIYGNAAGNAGGAIYSWDDASEATNCILWDNTAASGSEIYSNNSAPLVRYSCVQGGYAGRANIDANPLFVDAANTDFRLQVESPCMESGTDADAPAQDIRGVPRPQGQAWDMGAYETSVPVITIEGEADITVECGMGYVDAGASAWDDIYLDLSGDITADNPVDTDVVGVYTVRYNVVNPFGVPAVEATREVAVVNTSIPAITVIEDSP